MTMPLVVYATPDLLKGDAEIRTRETNMIDISSIPSADLVEHVETIRTHQKIQTTIYLGFLDPIWMLSPYHETLLRRAIRECRLILLTSDPTLLSFSWKNGLDSLILVL
jgi:hypothetical protein